MLICSDQGAEYGAAGDAVTEVSNVADGVAVRNCSDIQGAVIATCSPSSSPGEKDDQALLDGRAVPSFTMSLDSLSSAMSFYGARRRGWQ